MIEYDRHARSTVHRWVGFNIVGATGVLVQLAVLTLLQAYGVHYLLATAVGVEAAVLNNFNWHERWTWSDRTRGDRSGIMSRLIRFNMTVGVISIAQNLIFMRMLVGYFDFHFLIGNLISITLCSVVNFLINDRVIFKASQPDSRLAEEHGNIRI